jgi:hypothetical protein
VSTDRVFRKSSTEHILSQILTLSDGAYRLHDSARQWCVRHRKDGLIPAHQVRGLTDHSTNSIKRYVAELVAADLWIPRGDKGNLAYFIPATLEHNWSNKRISEYLVSQGDFGKKGAKRRYQKVTPIRPPPAG